MKVCIMSEIIQKLKFVFHTIYNKEENLTFNWFGKNSDHHPIDFSKLCSLQYIISGSCNASKLKHYSIGKTTLFVPLLFFLWFFFPLKKEKRLSTSIFNSNQSSKNLDMALNLETSNKKDKVRKGYVYVNALWIED